MAVSLRITPDSDFSASWQYLVNWVLAVILGLAFVFYFARLVGYIISLFLEVFLWKRHHVRVTIGAFRISPLGGRVMARNVVISTADYTVSILRLNLTWRYWLLKMTRLPSFHFSAKSLEMPSGLTPESNSKLPTSLLLHIDGLEVFMYNRTAAYTNIEEMLQKCSTDPDSSLSHRLSSKLSRNSNSGSGSGSTSGLSATNSASKNTPQNSGLAFWLQILPLQTTIKRGAFVLGNHTTPSILVASFRTAKALYDISGPSSKADLYRTNLDISMDRFQVHMKPNITYDPEKYSTDKPPSLKKKAAAAVKNTFRQRSLSDMLTYLRLKRYRKKAKKDGIYEWQGLRRYVGEFPERVVELTDIEEYAKYSLILDSVSTQLLYYYDVPGVQPQKEAETEDGDLSPQFGVDIVLSMATVHYGSWADRQRGPLQALLFPALARDSEPTLSHNEPGVIRKYGGFNLQVRTENELIIRVPTREFSKDKEELATREEKQKNTRPFGWLELKLGKGTEITYFNSYVATSRGWANALNFVMADLEMRTSVTHDILFTADKHTVGAEIGFPLRWNGECTWKFTMDSTNGRFFFLREHVTLFVDMISDFGSGPPASYENYRPFTYLLHWSVHDFQLFFNVNDHNIINDPLDFDSNKYICFSGGRMDVDVEIPLRGMFAVSSTVKYEISAPSLDLTLEVPPWHTVSAFMNGSKKMGSTDAFEIAGSYTYYNRVEVDHNNFAVLNITGDNIVLLFHGYFIRYLFTFRENYFGDFVNFRTYEEYILSEGMDAKDSESTSVDSPKKPNPEYWKLLKAENDLNILFTFKARKGMIVLPCQIYDHTHHISLCFDYLDVDIHLCQFYMDLQADFSTGSGYHVIPAMVPNRDVVFESQAYGAVLASRRPEIIIDAFSVHTHRMLGIDDLTYQCKWDFASDLISIEGSPSVVSGIDTVLDNFILGYKDLENSLTYQVPIVYDAANFTFRCPEIRLKLTLNVPNTFLEITIDDILVSFNDIANFRYSSRISLLMPKIVVKIIDETSGTKYDAYMETSLHLTDFCQKLNMKEHRELQHEHIRRNDATTHRASFLLYPEEKDELFQDAKGAVFSTVSLPMASFPLTEEYLSYRGANDSESTMESFSDYSEESSYTSGEMYPTTDYLDEDYKPLSGPDNQFKNDTFVLKFDTVKACVCPKGLYAISTLVLGTEVADIDLLLDKLQVKVLKDLKVLIMPVSMIDNVRLVSPLVDVRVVEQSMVSPNSVFHPSQPAPVLTLAISEPSLVLQKTHSRVRMGPVLEEHASLALAVHVSEFYVAVSLPDSFSAAFSFQVSEIEAWLTKNEGSAQVVSSSLNTMKANVNEPLLADVVCFLKVLLDASKDSIENIKRASENAKRWKGDLLYSLCKFASDNKITSDPEVITKPARSLRSKRDHVRFYESWKIMMKFRSIASEIQPNDGTQYDSTNESQRAPDDAMASVTESFRTWRTWEGNMGQREEFFRTIFEEPEEQDNGLKAFLNVSSVEFNVTRKDEVSDFVALLKINVQATKTGNTENTPGVLRALDVAVSVDSIDVALSPTVFSLAESVKIFKSGEQTESSPTSEESSTEQSISLLINLNSLRSRFNFAKTHLELSLEELTASAIGSTQRSAMSFGWASKLGALAVSFGKNDAKYLSFVSEETTVVASGIKETSRATIVVESNTRNVDMKVLDHGNTLALAISEFLNEDLRLVMEQSGSTSKKDTHKLIDSNDAKDQIKPRVTLRFVVEKLGFMIDALHPLKVHGLLTGATSKVLISGSEHFGEYAHKSFTSEVGIYETSIVRANSSDFYFSSLLSEVGRSWLVKTDVQSDYFKMTTPSLLLALDAVLKSNKHIMGKVDDLRDAVVKNELMSKSESVNSKRESEDAVEKHEQKKIYFMFRWRQKYCGWFTYREQSRFTLEIEDTSVTLGNTGTGAIASLPSGELLMPATRITIYDPQFSVGLATLLDYHLSVKILNDSAEDSGSIGQSLQVESEHFRVCLSPPVLLKLLELTDSLKHKLDQYDGFVGHEQEVGISEVQKEVNTTDKEAVTKVPKKPMFTSVHVLSYNFCIGWLFGASHKDYPGLILGAERIFAVTKADMGKLTVMDGYLSVANGSSSSNFYSSTSEIDNLNRAFMPKLQLNYYVDKRKKLWLTLKGDELDVRCMSNSTVLIERAMKSGTTVRSFFEEKSNRADSRKHRRRSFDMARAKPPPSKAFDPHFSAVQCVVGFAGARIFIYKLQEDNLHEEPNSLTLQSPAISVVVDYKHVKKAAKKHVLKAEILMSQSDNTVYSSCVPVVEDFVRTFKSMFKTPHGKPASRKAEKETKPSNLGAELGSMFGDADLHIGMRIEKQRISLSCEPTAKVAAVVEYDGASISACSGVEAMDSIYVLGQISSVSASLQHIYSDERSGSLLIQNIILSSMIAFKTDLEIVSSCCISDISGYVKMKQYQDVDLFTDIWFPNSYSSNTQEVEDVNSVNQSRAPQSSAVSGLSVALDFIFANIMLEVDFGPALGIMVLDIDKAWAISRKISSWSYELKVGLQTLVVGSEGRLGGYLKLGGLFLNSAIDWKLDDMPLLEVPLVHMAGGFGEFQLKSIFDEHVFAFANLKGWRFDVYNRKNGANISKDHLFVSIRYSSAEAFLTSLAVSDFYDIYETILRMVEEKRTSYKEILKDSNKESFMNRSCSNEFLEVARKLDTQIEVFTGITTIQVYPHSFHDTKVFVIQLDRSTANFTQNEYELGVSNQIELQLNNVKASFSSTAGTTKEKISAFDVDELSEYASRAKGGTILGFPRFMISMRTYQKFHTNLVEYLFQSSFGGAVDIRWNLGSVNCVREMYAAHKRALLSRTEFPKDEVPAFKDDLDLSDIIAQDSANVRMAAEEEASRMLASAETPHKDFDKDIQQTMEKVTSKSKFTYSALAPAIIEAPQLKELGNATPPLEWFGLHRNKFPDATHQLAIVTLQKIIHEIELEYSKTLGRA